MTQRVADSSARLAGVRLAGELLADLASATADPPGITRAAFGEGEHYAHARLGAAVVALGAERRVDAFGNLYLTLPGRQRQLPALLIGSHADSVPHGGNFDGAAGVAGGIAVMANLVAQGARLPRDLTVLITRAEEAAWFPLAYPGSLAALGRLPPEALEALRSDTGRSLADHMAQAGFDPEPVRRGIVQIAPRDIAAFIELHIEQGPRLVAAGAPIGIVTGIAGGLRYTAARCVGRYAHSGAEPRFARHDAVLGFNDFVTALEREWDAIEQRGGEATITFGRVESDPAQHGGSRVLGDLGFTLDLRSIDAAILTGLERRIGEICADIAARRGVSFELGPIFHWNAAAMDAGLMAGLSRAAASCGLAAPPIPSGAGHDAAAFAEAGVPTAMVFVRNRNGSHNPDEAMEMEDLAAAIALLTAFVIAFDG
ncbi:Zn-dependent hydrolase [Ancylobacter amanitiformis]|uniref:N-carbamoyl-L-amino-acid hydrolase n=1 Tax=Ancylobacter amanitiformis TaxID=217069 RepID=A0ABU0LUD0_9HYPH|nr:Zn-dependent hydrolase [Ancylobacter amanitiformis]MDQ0512274.1 N-carbamoyl-L-amino-acid hydrolase [Ancylobacter amanitiformis]